MDVSTIYIVISEEEYGPKITLRMVHDAFTSVELAKKE